jgi:hypothetical protein
MKKIVLAAAILVAVPVLAGTMQINPADYPLSAKTLSYRNSGGTEWRPTTSVNASADMGIIIMDTKRLDREEIQIGDRIYVASLKGRDGIVGNVGDTFPARLGKKGRFDVIYLLGTDKKHGTPKIVALRVVGERPSTH